MSTSNTGASGMNVVSEQVLEFLVTELSLYAAKSCSQAVAAAKDTAASGGTPGLLDDTATGEDTEETLTVAAEMAAGKLERMGHAVGYRITERLAQNKTWNTSAPSKSSNAGAAANSSSNTQQQQQPDAAATAAQQLEAVKFLCKEVWMEIFRKQIDKLQTNHRGVFVLKDLELKWLTRFPVGTEHARVSAIRLLAFPCGIIRGALANLGIPAVVSCDFLADGQRMAACSFNIKVK